MLPEEKQLIGGELKVSIALYQAVCANDLADVLRILQRIKTMFGEDESDILRAEQVSLTAALVAVLNCCYNGEFTDERRERADVVREEVMELMRTACLGKKWWMLECVGKVLAIVNSSEAGMSSYPKRTKELVGIIGELVQYIPSEPQKNLQAVMSSLITFGMINYDRESILMLLNSAHQLAAKGCWGTIGHVDCMLSGAISRGDLTVIEPAYSLNRRAVDADQSGMFDCYDSFCCLIGSSLEKLNPDSTSERRSDSNSKELALRLVSECIGTLRIAVEKGWWLMLSGIDTALEQAFLYEMSLFERPAMTEQLCELIKRFVGRGTVSKGKANERLIYERLLAPFRARCEQCGGLCGRLLNHLKKNNSEPALVGAMLKLAQKLAGRGWWWAIGDIDQLLWPAIWSKDLKVIESAYDLLALAVANIEPGNIVGDGNEFYRSVAAALERKEPCSSFESPASNLIELMKMAECNKWEGLLQYAAGLMQHAKDAGACDVIEAAVAVATTVVKSTKIVAPLIVRLIVSKVQPQRWVIDAIAERQSRIAAAAFDLCELFSKSRKKLIEVITEGEMDFSAARQALIECSDELLLPILQRFDRWGLCHDVRKVLTHGLLNDENIQALIMQYVDGGKLSENGAVAAARAEICDDSASSKCLVM